MSIRLLAASFVFAGSVAVSTTTCMSQTGGNLGALPQQSTSSSRTLDFNQDFNIECLRKIDVAAQADGLIQEMDVEEGTTVPQGGLLFRIDNRVAKAQLEVATKKLESAQKEAEQDAEIRFYKATYDVALAEYESEFLLYEKRATTEAVVRRKKLEANKAKVQVEMAEVKQQTQLLAVGVADAERNAAEVQLSLYDIVAPWDAYVNERLKDQGAWIRAGEPVLKIHHMSQMKVVGFIKLRDLLDRGLSISSLEGAKIRVIVDITPRQQHTVDSEINFVSSDVDPTGRIRVSANLTNERIGNSWLLRDGVPARVAISID